MNRDELYKEVTQEFLENLDIKDIHPLHKAIFEECCENALNNPQNVKDKEALKYAVQVAFLTSLSVLKGTIIGGLKYAEEVNLNYRDETFVITKDSPLLKD